MSFSVMLYTISTYIQSVNDNAGNGIKVLDGTETITITTLSAPPPHLCFLRVKL